MAEYDKIDISERMIKRVYQKNVIFVTIGILKTFVLRMNHILAMTA